MPLARPPHPPAPRKIRNAATSMCCKGFSVAREFFGKIPFRNRAFAAESQYWRCRKEAKYPKHQMPCPACPLPNAADVAAVFPALLSRSPPKSPRPRHAPSQTPATGDSGQHMSRQTSLRQRTDCCRHRGRQ